MKILMMTNTYKPFIGGVPRSVETFTEEYRKLGHQVKIVAPNFEGQEEDPNVTRVPALQHFNGTDFSVEIPIPFFLSDLMEEFKPDIIHSHHPFLLGNTALRLASHCEAPLIYTFHTFYERYTHYIPGEDSEAKHRFVNTLVTGYANLCDQIFAPSLSVAKVLQERGVTRPIEVVPTGINVKAISQGNGTDFRISHRIPAEAFIVGFVSRLALEKNLEFLCNAVLPLLELETSVWFVIAGSGPLEEVLRKRFETHSCSQRCSDRILMLGDLKGSELYDFYRAMDVFAFASHSETQGLVVTEAMAGETPVVALDAPGIREVVQDGINGRLLQSENESEFTQALHEFFQLPLSSRKAMGIEAKHMAETLSDEVCAKHALEIYSRAKRISVAARKLESGWEEWLRQVSLEWELLVNLGRATGEAVLGRALVDKAEK